MTLNEFFDEISQAKRKLGIREAEKEESYGQKTHAAFRS
jgi:hypothetical protein